ncbi:hypothetical protein HZA97_07705 [Candidatus Woesearchaeota archaeon]|nr:hypothetical protein [Candidatus Woesearchaeota archaeon]
MATNATAHVFYGVQLSEERALELFGEYAKEDMRTLDDLEGSEKVQATGLDLHVFSDDEYSDFLGAYLGRELGSTGEIADGSDFTAMEFNADLAAEVKNKLAKLEIIEPAKLYLFTHAD